MKDNIRRVVGVLVFIAIVLTIIYINNVNNNENGTYIETKIVDLKNINEDEYYVVYYSESCATCKKLDEDINEIMDEYTQMKEKKIYGINVDSDEAFTDDVMKNLGVEGVPFVVRYEDGAQTGILYEDIKKDEIISFFGVETEISLIYFYSPTCASCHRVREYCENILEKYKDINICEYSIAKPANKVLLNKYCKEYNVSDKETGTVPIVFIRDTYLYGDENVEKNLERIIDEDERGKTLILEAKESDIGEEYQSFEAMDLLKVSGAAVINGLNPCSLSMIFFLCMLLECKKDKLLKMGIFFSLGKCVAFIMLGTIFYKLMYIVNGGIVTKIINVIMLILILICMVLNINDYIAIKRDRLNNIRAQLPSKVRSFNFDLIKTWVSKCLDSRYILIFALTLGMIIALTEFLCSGQIYLSTIVTIIQVNEDINILAILYLVCYSIIYSLPTLIIAICIAVGRNAFDISDAYTRNMHRVKLIYALFFAVVAVYLVFQIV